MSRIPAIALFALATLSACETTPTSPSAPAFDPGETWMEDADIEPDEPASADAPKPVSNLAVGAGCERTTTTMSGTIEGQQVWLSLWDAGMVVGDIVGDAFLASDTDDLYIIGELRDPSGAVIDQVDGRATPDGRLEIDSRTLPEAEVFYGTWRAEADGSLSVAGDHAVCDL